MVLDYNLLSRDCKWPRTMPRYRSHHHQRPNSMSHCRNKTISLKCFYQYSPDEHESRGDWMSSLQKTGILLKFPEDSVLQ
ncbi:hypothetical protein NPIL_157391 [Nephila pilipes]|uniref:Uncharacterized protein n=1 Tax=Nephila pilipes TaxID=299642 RepID=A0A8X6NB91_NEPPI|nr:hypothetical protein NPIL_157391 [Nephila pilipes]